MGHFKKGKWIEEEPQMTLDNYNESTATTTVTDCSEKTSSHSYVIKDGKCDNKWEYTTTRPNPSIVKTFITPKECIDIYDNGTTIHRKAKDNKEFAYQMAIKQAYKTGIFEIPSDDYIPEDLSIKVDSDGNIINEEYNNMKNGIIDRIKKFINR